MTSSLILFLVSAAALLATVLIPGWSDFLTLSAPCFLAASILLIRSGIRRVRRKQWVVVDGSNVMHWRDGKPRLENVKEAVAQLEASGFTPGVVFDANAGYLLFDKYLHHRAFAKRLGLPEERVMVVPNGTPADPTILAASRDHGARILTNDQFRDWSDQHPEIKDPGYLITGRYASGRLKLDL